LESPAEAHILERWMWHGQLYAQTSPERSKGNSGQIKAKGILKHGFQIRQPCRAISVRIGGFRPCHLQPSDSPPMERW